MAAFDSAWIALAKALTAKLPAGVQPEDQLTPPVKTMLEALVAHIEAFTEARIEIVRP